MRAVILSELHARRDARDQVAVEVLGNIAATESAIEPAGRSTEFDRDDLLSIHRSLMERSPTPELGGIVRTEQNWIGGSAHNPCSAAFVPPPPEYVEDLLADVLDYVNGDDHSPLRLERTHPGEAAGPPAGGRADPRRAVSGGTGLGWLSYPVSRVNIMELAYDEAKFTELVLHVAGRLVGDRTGGAIKLNKVLFFAEFTHLRRHHAVISGCEFQKLPHGPAPRQLLPVRERLLAAGQARLVAEDFLGRPQHRLVPERPADLSVFSPDELASIDDVLDQLEGMTGTQVSELSHQEPGWRLTEVGETIPYSTAFLDFPQVATPTSERLSREVAERYGLAVRG